MAQFVITVDPIDASGHRVVSIWFGDVDRIALRSDPCFTGSAVLTAVYTISGNYQYYIVYIALDRKIAEVWCIDPPEIPIAEAAITQREILQKLKSRGIVLTHISSESRHFQRIISMLPLAYDDISMRDCEFSTRPENRNADRLSEEEKKALRDLLIHF